MSELTPEQIKYFTDRMELLGITEEQNRVKLLQYNAEKKENELIEQPIFRANERGIDILVYTLERLAIPYAKEGARWKHQAYCITRLREPIVKKNGDTQKYQIPKGQGTYPFFHPVLIDAYENKLPIDTLYVTEGFFKSFKGCMHGIPTVGVSSITHLKEKEKGTLHADILALIKTCQVKRVVWLTDGDCKSLTHKDIADGMDLYKKPKGFFNSANSFQQLLADYPVEKWFAHIESDALPDKPKGLDDLLCSMKGNEAEVKEDLLSFSKPGKYAYKQDITYTTGKLLRYLQLDNVDNFYLHHVQEREDLKGKEFIFNGTRYKWDEEKSACQIMVPGEANTYFRVGDQYHEFISIPNKYGELEHTFHRRQKGTIIDDHGREIIRHIPRYKAFCNVPDHMNFQQVIYSNFNMYAPFEHEILEEEVTEEDCKTILAFLRHIFGNGQFEWTHPKDKTKHTINEVDLGLDYIQILYKYPTQILPILCLVSKENNTGKTTLGKLLKLIFTANVAIVGNAELSDNFNASWSSKLIIICDEAKIDKQIVVEKVKSLSTADKIMMNAKGKDHTEIDFFGKFIFITNFEENFIYASDEDVRYWVRKVPVIRELNVNMLQDMIDEIPAFLTYLSKRKLSTEKLHRGWFDPNLIKTEALKKVIAYSRPTIEKDLRQFFRDKFFDFGMEELLMTRKAIHKDCFRDKYEANYLETVLKENLRIDLYHEYEYDGMEFTTLEAARAHALKKHGNADLADLTAKKAYKTKRHRYPRWEETRKDGSVEHQRVDVQDNGRPYVIHRSRFLTPEEIATIKPSHEQQYITDNVTNVANEAAPTGDVAPEDLPF